MKHLFPRIAQQDVGHVPGLATIEKAWCGGLKELMEHHYVVCKLVWAKRERE
jgi:hypothetical protein